MKRLIHLVFIITVFSACQKETSGTTETTPKPAQTISNVSYGPDAKQKMDLYLPAGRTDTTKLIVLVHGGAWVEGDKADFAAYIPDLQQRLPGWAIANINYRLASTSGNFFPTQENDMKAAIDFLMSKRSEYGYSQNVVLLGASAGAHIALLQAYKQTTPRIRAVVNFFGPADMTGMYNAAAPQTQFGLSLLLGGTPSSNSTMYNNSSPVRFVNAQSPPTIILHGDNDNIVPLAQSTALRNALQAAGVPVALHIYSGYGHEAWPPAVMDDAFDKIIQFLQTHVP